MVQKKAQFEVVMLSVKKKHHCTLCSLEGREGVNLAQTIHFHSFLPNWL